jgi:hypothetical protein
MRGSQITCNAPADKAALVCKRLIIIKDNITDYDDMAEVKK